MSLRRVLLTAFAASALAAADLAGKWSGVMETNGSRIPMYLTVSQQDGKLTGVLSTGQDAKQTPIEKPELDGDKLAFEVHDNAGRVVKFRLSLTGAGLTGESAVDNQTSKVVLSRSGGGGGSRVGGPPVPAVREGVFRVGGGVSAPMLIHKVEPEYSEEARAAKYQGTVLLYVEIDPNGRATNIKVQRSLGLGLDQKAVEAVEKWRFKPGHKDGTPVTVAATIEVNFRL